MELMERLKSDMESHGEVHIVMEEHDAEVEARLGTTTFDFDAGVMSIYGPDGCTQHFDFDRVVRWYKPMEVFH